MPRKSAPVKPSKSSQKAVEKALRAACPVRFLGVLENRIRVLGVDQVAFCCYCGFPAQSHAAGPAKTECDGCWEVTSRLGSFLRDGGAAAQAVVRKALRLAEAEARRAGATRPPAENATEALTQALASRKPSSDVGPSEGAELASRVWDHGEDFEP